MAWVKFRQDWDWRLPSSTTAYKAGWSGNITRDCESLAIAAGAAVSIKTPRKGEEPEDGEQKTNGG